jgi:hypothetical protein
MKLLKTTSLVCGLLLSGSVYAQNTSDSESNSNSGASNAGNNQGVVIEGSTGSSIPKQAPSVVAPSLTTTLSETCMGSTSGGMSGPGFGLSFGSTWRDEACVRRLDARELRSFGAGMPPEQAYLFHIAATERMCEDPKIRAAFERTAKRLGAVDALCQTTADQRIANAPGNKYVTRQDIDGEDHRGKAHFVDPNGDSSTDTNTSYRDDEEEMQGGGDQ